MSYFRKAVILARLVLNQYRIYLRNPEELLHRPADFRACGRDVVIRPPTIIAYKAEITLENSVRIQDGCHIVAKGGLTIGENTTISSRCMIFTATPSLAEGWPAIRDVGYDTRPITIGRNVFIGAGACICPGAQIGEGAIIGMGAVVAGVIPPLAMAAGNPAKVIRYRDRDFYETKMADRGSPDDSVRHP